MGIVIVIAAIFLSVATPTPAPKPASGPEKPRVMATFFPLFDFTRRIGGDTIEVDMLFSQTPEVTSFSPSDIRRINEADLIVKNGLGLEVALDDLIAASDNRSVKVIDTSVGITALEPAKAIEREKEPDGEEHGHGPVDPHIWLDPHHAMIQAGHIRDGLKVLDPAHAREYEERTQNLLGELNLLHEDIASSTAGFRTRDFVAFHSAFHYFAARYGLNQVAVIEPFPGKEPSPQYLAGVIRTIRDLGITAIFSEPQFSPKVVEVIAADLGIKVYELDPIETGDPDRDSYILLMRKNLEVLEKALK